MLTLHPALIKPQKGSKTAQCQNAQRKSLDKIPSCNFIEILSFFKIIFFFWKFSTKNALEK
jgi:hypothetical protein